MKKTKHKLVWIEWEDSVLGYQGWKLINEEPKEVSKFISVGFLIHSDSKCKILYPHIKESDSDLVGSGDIVIPNSAIKKIRVLK
jgi:hypothetical protein